MCAMIKVGYKELHNIQTLYVNYFFFARHYFFFKPGMSYVFINDNL